MKTSLSNITRYNTTTGKKSQEFLTAEPVDRGLLIGIPRFQYS